MFATIIESLALESMVLMFSMYICFSQKDSKESKILVRCCASLVVLICLF